MKMKTVSLNGTSYQTTAIRSGSFSSVHMARACSSSSASSSSSSTCSSRLYALKLVDASSHAVLARREASILEHIGAHPHIMSCVDSGLTDDGKYFAMVCELAQADLFDVIEQHGPIDERIARRLARQILSAMQKMADKHVAHRDIKLDNVLVSLNDDGVALKLGDFGFARRTDEAGSGMTASSSSSSSSSSGAGAGAGQELLTTVCGSEGYVSPEVYTGSYRGKPVDMWAFGSVLFSMIAGQMAFPSSHQKWYLDCIKANNQELFFKAHLRTTSLSPAVQSLLSSIFVWDADRRATIDEVLAHPWFADNEASAEDVAAALRPAVEAVAARRHPLPPLAPPVFGPHATSSCSSEAVSDSGTDSSTVCTPTVHTVV